MDNLHQESKISVGPSTGEFTPGLQLEGHLKLGTEYDNEVSHMKDEHKKAAAVFGFKLTLSDANVGTQAVETLTQLLEMATGIDQVKEMLDRGLDISFRHEGLNVFINIAVPETLQELQMIPGWNLINLKDTVFSGKHDGKITSGVDPTKFLTATLDEMIERACNFSIEASGNMEEGHHLLSTITGLAKQLLPNHPQVDMVLSAVNLMTAFKSLNWEFKYDPSVVRTTIKNMMESSGKLEKVQHKVTGNQELANGFLPQAQMMAPMFIGPYAELLKSVNLGHFELFFMVPRLRLHAVQGITLFGLNSFVQEKFLSQ
jgi:hypothetical protein